MKTLPAWQIATCERSGFAMLAIVSFCLLLYPCSSLGNVPKNSNEEIPPLKPPQAEISPSAWEENGAAMVTAGLLALAGLCTAAWLGFRPQPAPVVPPETQARRQLETLRGQPQTGQLLSAVSRVTRSYFREAFGLPVGEVTTAEFCEQLAAQERLGPSLGTEAQQFLRRCDEFKFSTSTPPAAFDAAAESLKLVELGENRLVQARRMELEKAADARKAGG